LFLVSCSPDNTSPSKSQLPSDVAAKIEIDRQKRSKKSAFPQCRKHPKIQVTRQEILNETFELPNGKCLNPKALKFFGKTAALFRFSEGERTQLCHENINFADLKFQSEGDGSSRDLDEGESQKLFNLWGDDTALSLVTLKADINLANPPYSYSRLSAEIRDAYVYDVDAHVLKIQFTEDSLFDGGEAPLVFRRVARHLNGPQRSFDNGWIVPRKGPPGQDVNDPLRHYYVRTGGDKKVRMGKQYWMALLMITRGK